jgi:hypothetical protein
MNVDETIARVMAAVTSPAALRTGLETLEALAARTDAEGADACAALTFHLQQFHSPSTQPVRRFLAGRAAAIEERATQLVKIEGAPLPPIGFVALLQGEAERAFRVVDHPLARALREQTVMPGGIRVFARDLWHRMRTLHSDFTELLVAFPPSSPPVIFPTMYTLPAELAQDGLRVLLRRLLDHLGTHASFDDTPQLLETLLYLSGRLHAFTRADTAWGLGTAYAVLLERGTCASLLNDAFVCSGLNAVPDLVGLTRSATPERLGAIVATLQTTRQQEACLTSMRTHLARSVRVLDAVWRAIRPKT